MPRIPTHVGIIPDGNRRWALDNGLSKQDGYQKGLDPGLEAYKMCKSLGVKEMTYYGFTVDNTKRPKEQTIAFQQACIDAVYLLAAQDADLLVMGNTSSPLFPKELLPYTQRTTMGKGGMKINFLVNYGWQWDLMGKEESTPSKKAITDNIHSSDISRIDLIIRWGGRRRLSGFLPVQTIYSDFYVIDDYWPDFKPEHVQQAIDWYQTQDVTLGG